MTWSRSPLTPRAQSHPGQMTAPVTQVQQPPAAAARLVARLYQMKCFETLKSQIAPHLW